MISEKRTIEVYSPDGVHSVILRASSSAQADAWISGLCAALAEGTELALRKANLLIRDVLEGSARHMGWLLKRSAIDSSTNSIKVFIWVSKVCLSYSTKCAY